MAKCNPKWIHESFLSGARKDHKPIWTEGLQIMDDKGQWLANYAMQTSNPINYTDIGLEVGVWHHQVSNTRTINFTH